MESLSKTSGFPVDGLGQFVREEGVAGRLKVVKWRALSLRRARGTAPRA